MCLICPSACTAIWDRAYWKAYTRPCLPENWLRSDIGSIGKCRSIYISKGLASTRRIDLLVDNRLLVEIKSVERLNPAHGKQLLTYLRLTGQSVGLLINFGGATLKEGVRRIVNDHKPSASPRLRVNR